MKNAFLLFSALLVIGCGDSAAPDPAVDQSRAASATEMRTLFNKAGGDWTKLTPDDKAAFVKMFNGKEDDAKKMWDTMAGMGAPGASAGQR